MTKQSARGGQKHLAHVPWGALAVSQETDAQARPLMQTMMQTVTDWSLIEEGDRVMVALSGGKDSYTLFDLLSRAVARAPFDVSIIGVHLDQAQPGYEPTAFYNWLEAFGAPYEIIREDTYSVVKEKSRPGQTYCVICSRLRRGILYTTAERLGCNKIALGHHRDDALETFLMNVFFAGKMQAMPARYDTDDGRYSVIRPLIDMAESKIQAYATERAYPILPCNLCGSQEGLKREEMKAMLADMSERHPHLREVMHNALQNVRPSHLLDADVAQAWRDRDPSLRPNESSPISDGNKPYRHKADVVRRGHLPIVGQ